MKTYPQQPQFFAQLAQEFPKVPPHFIARIGLGLITAARRQSRLSVGLCNGWISQETYDRRKDLVNAKISDLLLELNPKRLIPFITGGDPRGAALKLVLPSGAHNTWGGKEEGYAVPEGK